MSEFFQNLGTEISETLTFFLTVALMQNVILTTGFGSSLMLHIVRKPKNIWIFSAILGVFSVLTVLIAYPLDMAIGTGVTMYWRPFMMIAITAVLYVAITLLLMWLGPNLYQRIGRLLPFAAFNNLVTGIALICNAHFESSLATNVGLAIGSCLSFGCLTWLVAEGIERMDNPDMPEAFRGMPSILVYVGLLALALMGFTNFSLI